MLIDDTDPSGYNIDEYENPPNFFLDIILGAKKVSKEPTQSAESEESAEKNSAKNLAIENEEESEIDEALVIL